MATHTEEDGFHEIQLNGKQLVFLFMAATVVSVVIFLCGVLVGRGVRAERATMATETSAGSVTDLTPQATTAQSGPPSPGSDPTVAAPPPAVDESLSYFDRLEGKKQPTEKLEPPSKQPAATAEKAARSAPAPAPTTKPPKPEPAPPVQTVKSNPVPPPASASAAPVADSGPIAAPSDPGGQGFALQIAALREKNEADAIARRLVSKGYGAYVMAPANGTPSVYRVRIGKFKTRREAETIKAKLEKEEQFNPWVTR